MADHYFSEQPGVSDKRFTHTVSIRGTSYEVETARGVFSHDGLDRGTAVLLTYANAPASDGICVDLGCGWGAVSLALATESTGRVIAVDINERARELTAINAERAGLHNIEVYSPNEALAIIEDHGIDTLWSNPPVRIGKKALHELMDMWLPHVRGNATMVMSKNLGADSFASWLADRWNVDRRGTAKGFRVFDVTPRD